MTQWPNNRKDGDRHPRRIEQATRKTAIEQLDPVL
jgi:hypothetical protein